MPLLIRVPSLVGVVAAWLALAATPALRAQDFRHPGLLHREADLQRIRDAIAAGKEPWVGAWRKLQQSPLSAVGVKPRATAVVSRGGSGDNIALLRIDATRAYQCALCWRIGGSRPHADTACDLLNAWSTKLEAVRGNSDRYLAVGICGYQLANAAELMRDAPGFDLERARRMFLEVFYRGADGDSAGVERFLYGNALGADHNGAHIGNYWANWDLCNLAAAVSIGVFCDRRDVYERAIDYLKYGPGNGSIYHVVPFVHPDGLGQWQEAGRDQGHTTLGIALLGSVAEMAWNQGDDLYGWADRRLLRGAEYVATYNEARREVPFSAYTWHRGVNGAPVVQAAIASGDRGASRPVWELLFHHYVHRIGLTAPQVAAAALARRPEGGPDLAGHPSSFDQPGHGTLLFSRMPGTGGKDARPHLGNVGDGTYLLVARHSGMALETADGAMVQCKADPSVPDQRWRLTHVGGGQYTVASQVDGRFLTVEGAAHGPAALVLADGKAGAHQRFAFLPQPDGFFRIVPTHSGQSIDVSGASRAEGAKVGQFAPGWVRPERPPWVPVGHQQWRLVKAPGVPQVAPVLRVTVRPGAGTRLEWNACAGATAYTVKRSWSPEGPFRILATGLAQTDWSDAPPGGGMTWHYRVAAVNAVGEGAESEVVSASGGGAR